MRKEIIEAEELSRFFANTIRTLPRAALAQYQDGQQFGGNRDLYEVCGYERELTSDDYLGIYERGDIAARIVDAYPDATWRQMPDIAPEGELRDKFWSIFSGKHGLLSVLHRLDRLTQLGHYGVLHIGVDDGLAQDQPVGKVSRVLYLQPHSEATAEITRWNNDAKSPRYGKPEAYRITTGSDWKGAGASSKMITVHHSRVIHVAEDPLENEAIGQPRLERGWNRLQDLQKLAGGSVESFWINAAMYVAFVADPDVNWQPDEVADMKEDLEKMANRLQRWLRLRGVDPKVLSAAIASPEPHFNMLIALLAGAYSIPKRILVGSERGELSSEQDEHNWASRVSERREQFAAPCILSPMVTWFQARGLLPKGEFDVVWPEADLLDASTRADIASKKTTALVAYSNSPAAESVVPVEAFRDWLGEDPDETPNWREDDEYVPMPSDLPVSPGTPEPVSVEPEATALNGAQITSLREIAGAVAAGELPPETAIAILKVAFPSISTAAAEAIIAPLRGFVPPAPTSGDPASAFNQRAWGLASDVVSVLPAVSEAQRAEIETMVSEFLAGEGKPDAPVTHAALRSLYVHRKVLNAKEILAWARTQGFKSTLPPGEMHVTVAYSKLPLDWMKLPPDWAGGPKIEVPPGGARIVEPLGNAGAAVLFFTCNELIYRHGDLKGAGASWDHASYQPHITITYDCGDLDLDTVEPYQGRIVLGPEVFSEIVEGWHDEIEEVKA